MANPPEVLFDRFLKRESPRQPRIRPEDPDVSLYRGKQDLEVLTPPDLRSLLTLVQSTINEALQNHNRAALEQVPCPPFHFDYIDSDIPNALAFSDGDFSFVGMTMALVYLLGDICVRLSRTEGIAELLGKPLTMELRDHIQAVLLYNGIYFFVVHEYAHHVFGHNLGSRAFDEVLDGTKTGTLDGQAEESVADAYAVHHIMANMIGGSGRALAITALELHDKTPDAQDQVLFACFVIVAAAYLISRTPVDITKQNVYELPYPPQIARLNYIMEAAVAWCRKDRPSLATWMTKGRFEALVRIAIEAMDVNDSATWEAQIAFLHTEAGADYIKKLGECIKAKTASL